MRPVYSRVPLVAAVCTAMMGLARHGSGQGSNVVRIHVEADPNGAAVSEYIAAANCHVAKRHVMDDRAWDRAMRPFFEGNLLVLLDGLSTQPDNSVRWNCQEIDAFILKANEVPVSHGDYEHEHEGDPDPQPTPCCRRLIAAADGLC